MSHAASDPLAHARFLALLGPLQQYVADPHVLNIHANEDDSIWIERRGVRRLRTKETMSALHRQALISYLGNKCGKAVDEISSRLSCDMPYFDARVQAFVPPVGHYQIVIRMHATRIYTLDEYVANGTLSEEHRQSIARAIRDERNIVVAGRMGSGKTTLLNACMHEAARIRPDYRCVVIQDRNELKASAPNHIHLFARIEQARWTNGNLSRYIYDFPDVLEDALRTDAQYLVWGELRDGLSALGLLMALNTGTRGFLTTVHADSAADTLHRIEDLLVSVGRTPQPRMIARFVNVIVHMDRDEATGKRHVREVLEVSGVDKQSRYVFSHVKNT